LPALPKLLRASFQPSFNLPSKSVTMSYADMAAKGPKQSAEDARAPALPEVEHTDDSVSSLIDVDSPHISSVPSDYESQSIKTDTQASREEHEEEVHREAKALKEKAAAKADKAKSKVQKNADNPVVLGNAVGLAVVAGVLGIGAYRKYARGELTALGSNIDEKRSELRNVL